MKQFKHSFVVERDIDTVWKFHTNIKHLIVITPKIMGLQILKSQSDIFQQGTEVWLSAKLVMKSKWHSKITYIQPYEYLDEMITGRFKIWKHLHKFNRIDEKKTQVIDEIDFELPYGVVGKLFENYVLKQLENIFAYREKTTIESLKPDSTNLTR
jgi:ligand-binding SRPBCC domain-containing protein